MSSFLATEPSNRSPKIEPNRAGAPRYHVLTPFVAAVDGDREGGAADGVEAYLVGTVDAKVVVGWQDVHKVRPCGAWSHQQHAPRDIRAKDGRRRRGGGGGRVARWYGLGKKTDL